MTCNVDVVQDGNVWVGSNPCRFFRFGFVILIFNVQMSKGAIASAFAHIKNFAVCWVCVKINVKTQVFDNTGGKLCHSFSFLLKRSDCDTAQL